jgi:AraC-like DNA-binding protein
MFLPHRFVQLKFAIDLIDSSTYFVESLLGVCLDKRVEKIIQMMRDDVRGELSLAEFAESVNLSIWRLSHIFKADVGMPPIRYLRLLRMERARHLLESSFLSVKEIAFQVGLNDESHFVRDFKAAYGFSPAIYRSNFKNNNGAESGHNASHGKQESDLRQQLARVAKQSLLPSLHLFVYIFSFF